MSTITVYSDFTIPQAWLASRRVDRLRAAGVQVDWRAVEFEPGLPVTGTRLGPDERDALEARFAALERVLAHGESLPHVVPATRPRTEAAVTAVAEAYGTPAADDVRALLMALYWTEGADIGSPAALRTPLAGAFLRTGRATSSLRESGFGIGVDRGPVSTAGWERIDQWRAQWRGLGAPRDVLVLVDGATLVGPDALERLGKELDRLPETPAGAGAPPRSGDPRRYPDVEVRPDPHWLTWVGGPWRTSHRLPRH